MQLLRCAIAAAVRYYSAACNSHVALRRCGSDALLLCGMQLLRCAYYARACNAVQAMCLSHVLRLDAMELASLGSISHVTVVARGERLLVPVPDGRVNARPTERMKALRRSKFEALRGKLGGTDGARVHVLEMGRDARRGRVRGEGLAPAHLCWPPP